MEQHNQESVLGGIWCYMDAKYLAEDLIENEPKLFG